MTTRRDRLQQSGYRRLVGNPSDLVAAEKEIEAILAFTRDEIDLALQPHYKSSDDIPGFRRAEFRLRIGAELFEEDCTALLAELDRLRAVVLKSQSHEPSPKLDHAEYCMRSRAADPHNMTVAENKETIIAAELDRLRAEVARLAEEQTRLRSEFERQTVELEGRKGHELNLSEAATAIRVRLLKPVSEAETGRLLSWIATRLRDAQLSTSFPAMPGDQSEDG